MIDVWRLYLLTCEASKISIVLHDQQAVACELNIEFKWYSTESSLPEGSERVLRPICIEETSVRDWPRDKPV